MESETTVQQKNPMKKALILLIVGLVCSAAGAGAGYVTGVNLAHQPSNETGKKNNSRHSAANVEKSRARVESPSKMIFLALDKDITSNLIEQNRFVQLSISLAFEDAPDRESRLKAQQPAIRSALLAALADQSAEDIATANGKNRLRIILRNAVNDALESLDEERSIDQILFTNFIIQ